MVAIPLNPYTLKDATLQIAADNYEAAVSSVVFTPSSSTTSWKGISGNTVTDASLADWTCVIGYAQDLVEDSLTRYLHEHEGESVAAVFTPVTGAGRPGVGVSIAATLVLVAGAIGGPATGGIVTASVTLGVDGKPQFVDA